MEGLNEYLSQSQKRVDDAINVWLPTSAEIPAKLHEAMRYSVFAGGKRIRPILCLTVAEGLGGKAEGILKAACALEILHTYSLIHDDLPALDNDDLRRGRPTSHKMFGEDTAILAGDALLTLAFEWMADISKLGISPDAALEAIQIFARATGHAGMVGGQVLDMIHENQKIDLEVLQQIHRLKTGALLRASIEIGAVLGNARAKERCELTRFGEKLGLLFQIVDDILDVEGDVNTLGKTPGSDQRKGKATYPSILGLAMAKEMAEKTECDALEILRSLPRDIKRLSQLTNYIHNRSS